MGKHSDRPGFSMRTLPLEDVKVAALQRLAAKLTAGGKRRTYGDLVRFAVDRYLEHVLEDTEPEPPQRSLRMFVAPPIGAWSGPGHAPSVERRLERAGDELDELEQWEAVAIALGYSAGAATVAARAPARHELALGVQQLAEKHAELARAYTARVVPELERGLTVERRRELERWGGAT